MEAPLEDDWVDGNERQKEIAQNAGPDYSRDIFGGSDSELSSAEDEPAPSRVRQPRAQDQYESSGDSGDDFAQPSKPKVRRRRNIGDGERRRKRKRTPQPEEPLGPEEERKQRMDDQFRKIFKKPKRPKKRKKDGEDEALDQYADAEVSRLRDAMIHAAREDAQANKEKLPALAKLRMLEEVMGILQRSSLQQSIMDNNLLEGVRYWLEPLPDKSLPALNIQRRFYTMLTKMYVDTNSLKESGLGRVVLFYTKCKRVTVPIRRMADILVENWSRPIIKRSASYRDREIPIAAELDPDAPRTTEKLNAILARGREADKLRVRRNAVTIPERSMGTYTLAPKSAPVDNEADRAVRADVERRRRNKDMLRRMTRKLEQNKRGPR